MIKGGLINIREALHSLTPMEERIARYILDHPNEVIQLSIQKLASTAGVSEATIIRLSQSLKYKGFKEFKLAIAGDLAGNTSAQEEQYQQFPVGSSTSALIESISYNNMKSIRDTLSVLSEEALEQAIEALGSARKIALFGVESSSVVADDFRQKALRLGLWCEPGYSGDSQAIIAANLSEQDVVLAVSYSGETESVLRAMQLAHRQGAKLIALTQFASSPIAEEADIALYTSTLERNFRNGAMASRIAQLNVIDILYVGLVTRQYDRNIELLERTKAAVRFSRNEE